MTRASTSRDHPRACGEHATITTTSSIESGSSPRLRGTHAARLRNAVVRRIIPALAGNTIPAGSRNSNRRDHPRACGEHSTPPMSATLSTGSSPRLRGTPAAVWFYPVRRGIIPALAGNTDGACAQCGMVRDHPRACGEHSKGKDKAKPVVGSSPRLRGTRRRHALGHRIAGIIPALAGNT